MNNNLSNCSFGPSIDSSLCQVSMVSFKVPENYVQLNDSGGSLLNTKSSQQMEI